MKFYISQLILWPKDISNKTQTLKFHDGEINIVHGVSGTGKSSIISIIDYCLGSSRCSIPVGIIREKVRWFGLKIYIKNKFYIIARSSPSYSSANDCHISITSESEQIPETISGNYSLSQFKQRLNILCQITNISIETNYDENEKYDPPSYRDLTSFNFQPQHIVANPNTLFYRSDSYNHKEKLKKVLPYAFNMRDAVYLAKERELSIARKDLEKKEKQQSLLINAYQTWEVDISNLWNKAVELGLTEDNPNQNTDDKLNNLKEIINIFDS
ncbi:AAA family ATPase, partial [Salmonella enterica]|nr:AAA family ATPase [Salmonella enterica]